jgi:hypothetical protein
VLRALLVSIFVAALVAGAAAHSNASAAPTSAQACRLGGSWVANRAETARYVAAINPTTTAITITSGALSATFNSGTFTFGSIGLELKGRKGAATIKQELDIQSVAPYTAGASAIALRPGNFKITYISTVIKTSSGVTVPVRLPNLANRSARGSLPYSCTPRVLHLRVPAGGGNVTLTLRKGA